MPDGVVSMVTSRFGEKCSEPMHIDGANQKNRKQMVADAGH